MPPPLGPLPPPRLSCAPGSPTGRFRVHVELFARRRVVIVPARIGIRRGCRFPVRTTDPTGVVEAGRPGLTLGDLFAVWRMPLAHDRLLTFRGTVTAYVAGRRWRGPVRSIPLTPHAEIVVETGGYVRPHTFFVFPPRRSRRP
jgi:hypothetical protein